MCLSEVRSQWGRGKSNGLPCRQSYCLKRTKQTPGLGVAWRSQEISTGLPHVPDLSPRRYSPLGHVWEEFSVRQGEGSLGSNLFPLLLKVRWQLSAPAAGSVGWALPENTLGAALAG